MDKDSLEGAIYMLIQFIKTLIELMKKNKNEYTKGTIQHYSTLLNHLTEFFRIIGKSDIEMKLIDTAFLQELDDHFMTWQHPKLGHAMNRNTANKYHSKLRAVLHSAKMRKLISENPYSEFKLKRFTPKSDFLLDQEIIKITGYRFDNLSLDICRDYLLFSMWSGGLRMSDTKNLKLHNIFEEGGFYFLHVAGQEKTNNSVHTPLLPGAVSIFKKYEKCQQETGFILPRISHDKVNRYLKIIGDLPGVYKRMTHKIARHSFGTSICSRNSVPRHIIAAWMGHVSRSRTTDIYAQVTKEESIFWIKKLYEIYNKAEYLIK
jgi:integrase/recombinase XerD